MEITILAQWYGCSQLIVLLFDLATHRRCNTSKLLFTKRRNVLPQDLVKSRSRGFRCYNDGIALKFDRPLGCAIVEELIKFQIEKLKPKSRGFETSIAFTWENFYTHLLMNLTPNTCLEIAHLKLLQYLPGASKLNTIIIIQHSPLSLY